LPSIEAALRAGKETQKDIAATFNLSRRAIGDHFRKHMPGPNSTEIPPLDLTGDAKVDAQLILECAAALVNRALQMSNIDRQIRAVDNVGKQLERAAKLWGEMPPDAVVQILQVHLQGDDADQVEQGPVGLLAGEGSDQSAVRGPWFGQDDGGRD